MKSHAVKDSKDQKNIKLKEQRMQIRQNLEDMLKKETKEDEEDTKAR